MLKGTLHNLGLSQKEVRIYTAVLYGSPLKTSQISRETGIPPQSVNSTLSKLIERGFIEQGSEGGVKRYYADPRSLLTLIDRRSQILNKERRELEKEMPKYLELEGRSKKFPRTTYYEGKEGQKRLFESMLDYWNKGAEKKLRAYGIQKFPKDMEGYLKEWVKKRHALGVKSQVIIGNGPEEYSITGKSNEFGRVVKNIDIGPQRASLHVLGDRAYAFSFENNVGVMIEERAIVNLLKDIFDNNWKSTTEGNKKLTRKTV